MLDPHSEWQLFKPNHFRTAYALVRLSLGVNILMHGVSRLDNLAGFAEKVGRGFEGTFVPVALGTALAYPIPIFEAAIGALLTIGLWTYGAAVAGALLMIPLIFGTNLMQQWNVAGLQLVYVGLYFILIAFAHHDGYSLDRLRSRLKPPIEPEPQ